MRINYKMLTAGFVLVAILVMVLSTAVLAAPGNQGKNGNAAYGAQNGSGQQNCQGNCNGTCDGNNAQNCDGTCEQNKEKGSGQCDGTCTDGRQGSAAKGKNRR